MKFIDGLSHLMIWLAKAIWSPLSDHEWNTDAYKIGGFLALGFAGWIAWTILELVKKTELAALATASGPIAALCGLVTVFTGAAYFLFDHSRKNDNALMGKGPGNGG